MFGLTYIRTLYNLSMEELSNKLNLSKASISLWENKKQNIPESRLQELLEIFNQEVFYFTKELDEVDKLKIQKQKIINEADTRTEIRSVKTDEGEEYSWEEKIYPNGIEEKLEKIDLEIEKEEIRKNFNQMLDKNFSKENYAIEIFNSVSQLINNQKVANKKVMEVLHGMMLYYGLLEGSDTRKLVVDILNIMKEDELREYEYILDSLELVKQGGDAKRNKLEMAIKLLTSIYYEDL